MPAGPQPFEIRRIDGLALALEVWSMRPLLPRTFIPVESEPVERVEDARPGLFRIPRLIGILARQANRPVRVAGVEPVEERRPRPPHVQIAGRRGCKSNADFGRILHLN